MCDDIYTGLLSSMNSFHVSHSSFSFVWLLSGKLYFLFLIVCFNIVTFILSCRWLSMIACLFVKLSKVLRQRHAVTKPSKLMIQKYSPNHQPNNSRIKTKTILNSYMVNSYMPHILCKELSNHYTPLSPLKKYSNK